MKAMLFALALAGPAGDDPVMRAMTDELARTKELKLDDSPAPYFATTTVVDVEQVAVAASLGALVGTEANESRVVSPLVRVGDLKVDALGVPMTFEPPLVGYEDDYDAIRRALWLLTDSAYKNAAMGHRARKTQDAQTTADPDRPDAFTAHKGVVALEGGAAEAIDRAKLEALAKKASAVFREFEHVQQGTVEVVATSSLKRMASTDGDSITTREGLVRIEIAARAQAEDGELLGHGVALMGDFDDFADDAVVIAAARKVGEELTQLRSAPVLEDYSGPVLYEGEAAGRFLADTFVPNLSSGLMWGNEFEKKMGQLVLPKGVAVFDDPTKSTHAGLALMGAYRLDAEGEAAQRVELVKDGKLVGLLSSRTPGKKVKTSNGHARGGMPGMAPQAGIGNLVIETKRGLSDAALEKKMLDIVRKRGLEHGLVVLRTQGAHSPAIAMKVGKDGRRSLVRVGFVGHIEPRTLRDIVALGKTPVATHLLVVGPSAVGWRLPAEYAPFTATATIVAPSILVGELELHRDKGGNPKPPSYPRPKLSAKP